MDTESVFIYSFGSNNKTIDKRYILICGLILDRRNLWILSLVGMTALDTGVLPVIMTSIFLLVLTVSYCVECIKQGC